MTFEWVDSESALNDVVNEVLSQPRYAIDTEFHREKTYYPKLALVQIKWDKTTALIDPLAVDPRGLGRLFSSDVLAVIHAAQQDLEVLRHAALDAPRRIFDCQVAAGFIGFSTPSLATLVQSIKKVSLSKGDRLTDWLRRPLTEQQCSYAADDVAYLFDLHDELSKQLEALGRTEWVHDACRDLQARPSGPQSSDDAWLKLKEARALKGASRGVAQSLAKWREERAMRSDAPPRRIMSDMALLGISQRIPKSVEELAYDQLTQLQQINSGINGVKAAAAFGTATAEPIEKLVGTLSGVSGQIAKDYGSRAETKDFRKGAESIGQPIEDVITAAIRGDEAGQKKAVEDLFTNLKAQEENFVTNQTKYIQETFANVSNVIKENYSKPVETKTTADVNLNMNVNVTGDANSKNMSKEDWNRLLDEKLKDPSFVAELQKLIAGGSAPKSAQGAKV